VTDRLKQADLVGQAGAPPLAEVLHTAARAWLRFCAGVSLDRALADALPAAAPARLVAAAKDTLYGATRKRALIEALIARLAQRPPAAPVAALIASALGQLLAERHADYAVVDQAVAASKADAATRPASGFVNALLRNFLRRRAALIADAQRDDTVRYNAPAWWIERLRAAYPAQWPAMLEAAALPPPLVLRVNRRLCSVDDYLARLRDQHIDATRVGAAAVWLHEPRPVEAIPGFADGVVSVQDAGAQLAAQWLDVHDGQRVLDACAAPGGKTTHIAELAAATIDAVDIDAARVARIEANLARTRLAGVRVHIADLVRTASFWDGQPYHRILLDAPCTASGIVRRHPDISWLRRPTDVAQLATQQAGLLDRLWPLLAPAGRLLYVVCSVFPEEGQQQVEQFLARRSDARAVPLPGLDVASYQLLPSPLVSAAWQPGRQPDRQSGALPTVHDGFFYALLHKL
jgi:16S rRNA (cytosine967-C5)-methyltransferase